MTGGAPGNYLSQVILLCEEADGLFEVSALAGVEPLGFMGRLHRPFGRGIFCPKALEDANSGAFHEAVEEVSRCLGDRLAEDVMLSCNTVGFEANADKVLGDVFSDALYFLLRGDDVFATIVVHNR